MLVENQNYSKSTLYIVATPIGNLSDMTIRAQYVLSMVDAIACEDTRQTQNLLRGLGFLNHPPLLSIHAHNEAQEAQTIVNRLAQGQRIAYVSDAGTPGISDPCARLVEAVVAAGLRVVPIPGASALTAILSCAGQMAHPHVFMGFLSNKSSRSKAQLSQLVNLPFASVIYEAPHRIKGLLENVQAIYPPERKIVIGRELTKQYETISYLTVSQLSDFIPLLPLRGEFALVIEGATESLSTDEANVTPALLSAAEQMIEFMPVKVVANVLAELTQGNKNALYEWVLALKLGVDKADDE